MRRHVAGSFRKLALALAAMAPRLAAQVVRVGEPAPIAAADGTRPLIEPHLAVDPRNGEHLLATAIYSLPLPIYRDIVARRTCVVFDSRDGGRTWMSHELAVPGCIDPWVAITRDGRAVFAALGTSPGASPGGPASLLVYHSPDGGRTWSEAPTDLGTWHDHDMVVVDPRADHGGWLYVVSSREVAGENGRRRWVVQSTRSRDGGRTFDGAVTLAPNNLVLKAEQPVVLADGTLVVPYVDLARNDGRAGGADLKQRRAWVMRSTDGGHSFSTPLFVTDDCGSSPFSLSALVADSARGAQTGRLYFACESPDRRGLALTMSSDLGETWPDSSVRLAATPDSVRRYKPALAVNRDGVLLATWVEIEGAIAGNGKAWTHCLSLHARASRDGGRTFSAAERVSRTCPGNAANGANSPAGGDYYGLVALPSGEFRVVWPDARAGAFHLWTSVVRVDPP
jgi:hypothetical protein